MPLGADDVEPTRVGHPRPQHDVGAAARHVGCDRDLARLTGLGHDRRLPLMLLGIEHVVGDAALFGEAGEPR